MICIWWMWRLGRCVVLHVDRVEGRQPLALRRWKCENIERRTLPRFAVPCQSGLRHVAKLANARTAFNVEPKRRMLRTEQRSVHRHTGGPPVPLLWTGLGKSRSMPPPLFCSKFGVECSKFGFSSGGRLPASASPCWDPGIERGKALTRVPGRI